MKSIFFDLETTGLQQPAICEIAYLVCSGHNLDIQVERCIRINPEIDHSKWEEKAIKTHGIKPEDVNDAETLFSAFYKYIAPDWIGGHNLVGYNINDFDVIVLSDQIKRYGLSNHFPWPASHVDLMPMVTRHLDAAGKRGVKRWKLGDAYHEIFKRNFSGAHNALADIKATYDIYKRIR